MDVHKLTILVLWFLWLPKNARAGHQEEFETDGKMNVQLVNDKGIPITREGKVYMEIKGCGNAFFILTQSAKFGDKGGTYYVVLLGTSNNGKINGIKDSCFTCKDLKATKYEKLLDCNRFNKFWVTWDDRGNIKFGRGMDTSETPLLDYTGSSPFTINYLNLLSSKYKVQWKIISDRPPVFVYPSGFGNMVIKVPENTTVDTTLLKVNATDAEGDEVYYSIDGDYSDIFECEDDKVKLIEKLDFETKSHYIVEITASDSLNDVKLAITIQVTDVNDETPEIDVKDDISISEELPIGTVIGGLIRGMDKDRDDTLIFQLEGQDSKYFMNVTSEGNFITNTRLDRDGMRGRVVLDALSVTVFDAVKNEKKAALNITVTDVNDNAPQFEQSVYKINITENQFNNLTILELVCSDADLGSNAQFNISLPDSLNGTFRLENDLLFVDGENVDLESMDDSVIFLAVIAVDTPDSDPPLTGSAQIIVKVLPKNDFDPTWTFPTTNENGSFPNMTIAQSTSPDVVIAVFKAEDKDAGVRVSISYSLLSITEVGLESCLLRLNVTQMDLLVGYQATYILYSIDPFILCDTVSGHARGCAHEQVCPNVEESGGNATGKFSLDPTTGVLTLLSPITLNETVFDLSIQASDGDDPVRTVTGALTLHVQRSNQYEPRFNQSLYTVQVAEDTAAQTAIYTVTADDKDGDNVTYDITGAWTSVFSIEGDQVKIVKKLDYESQRIYAVTIRASDGEKEDTAVLLVSVTDVIDEPPQIQFYNEVEIPRDVSVGTTIGGLFTVKDKDEKDYLTYTLAGNDSDFFQVHVSYGFFQVVKRLDSGVPKERKFLDSLTLTVTDKANISTSKQLNISLLEPVGESQSQPQLLRSDGYRVDVAENTTAGSVLYNITLEVAVDDLAAVVYTLIGEGNETFSFNGSLLILSREVDFESQSIYVLTISVTSGKFSTLGSMVLYILDINDEVPVISMEENITLMEEIPTGTPIAGLFQVADSDKGDNLTYSLTGNHSRYFDINPTDGQLRIRERIDRDGSGGLRVLEAITLTVVDAAGHETNKTFNVTIVDINDNPPFCGGALHKANVTENTTHDIVVTSLSCSDLDDDSVNIITVTITDGNDESVFEVNGTDIVAKGQQIDFDTPTKNDNSYLLTLHVADEVVDGISNTATVVVLVQVLPRNEHEPSWVSNTTLNGILENVTVASNTERGTTIVTLAASDNDAGRDGTITYQLIAAISDTGVPDPGVFAVDPTIGVVTNVDYLDGRSGRNTSQHYDITVVAADMGEPSRNITSTLRVSTLPVEWRSVFNTTATTLVEVDVAEDSNTGHVVHIFENVDANIYEFLIEGSKNETFKFTRNKLILREKLDYETQNIHVVNSRVFNAITTSYVTVVVTVNDVIDEPPVIELSPELKLAEELPVGSIVAGLFTVKDNDKNDTLIYSLSGKHSKYFSIDQSSGALSIAIPVDREGDNGVTVLDDLWLTVDDQSGLRANSSFSITVVDVNDNSPVCGSDIVNVNVTENSAPGLRILNLTCMDADSGPNANITLHLMNGSLLALFSIEESALVTVSSFDYENPGLHDNKYTLLVLATDHPVSGQSNTGTTVIQIQILPENECEPIWQIPNVTSSVSNTTEITTPSSNSSSTQSSNQSTQPAVAALPTVTLSGKTSVGTIVTRVVAKDKDTGPDGQLLYELVSVVTDTNESASSVFAIDSQSGIITLTRNLTDQPNGSLSYDLDLSVKDNGRPSKSARAQLPVSIEPPQNSPPSFSGSLSTAAVPEDAAVGDVIFNITVWDDDGDNVTTHIKGKAASFFSVSGTTVTLAKQLDFEKEAFHVCILSATDGTSTTESSLLVRVTNVMDEPPLIRVGEQTSLVEALPPGLTVGGLFTASDADEGDTLNYTLQGSHSMFFTINHVTGDIKMKEYLDYDGTNGLHFLDDLILIVEDSVQMRANVTLNLTVLDANDNSPAFSRNIYYANVTENSNASVLVLGLDCSDKDEGPNGNLTLNITGGDTESVFHLQGFQLFADASGIDFERFNETCPEFVLTIIASDSAENANTAMAVVIVKIVPKNEFVPKWRTPAGGGVNETFTADVDVGTLVSVVNAIDEDLGDDGIINYYIISSENNSNESQLFKLDEATGVLLTASSFSERSGEVYSLTVQATDNGTPPKHTDTRITLTVKPAPNSAPEFPTPVVSVTVAEDAPAGTVVCDLSVTDADGDDATLELIGDNPGEFIVDGYQIMLSRKLDYEKESVYVIAVRATDNKDNSSAVVRINVGDIIDETPVLEALHTVLIPEELPIGTSLGRFATVTDGDKGDNVTFSLYGEGSEFFKVDPHSGEVSINRTIDYDEPSPFREGTLILEAIDSAGLQNNITINVSITSINDNPPVFEQNVYEVKVQENSTHESALIQLNITDKDVDDSDNLSLTFDFGNENGYFRFINQSLYVQGEALDFEQTSTFTLVITARDNPNDGSSLTGSTIVTVKIMPKNEFAPVWSRVATTGNEFSSNQTTFNSSTSSVNNSPSTESSTLASSNSTSNTSMINDAETILFPVTISASAGPGTVVGVYQAVDADAGADGTVSYSIVSVESEPEGNTDQPFTYHEKTGLLLVKDQIKTDASVTVYRIILAAFDGGTPSRQTNGSLMVTVISDVVDLSFNQSLYRLNVPENTSVGEVLYSLSVHSDSTYISNVSFEIVAANTSLRQFQMDGNKFVLSDQLDYEDTAQHLLRVRAKYNGAECYAWLMVEVGDIIDERPEIILSSELAIPEELAIGSVVNNLFTVVDKDREDNLTYSLTGKNSPYFKMESGILSVAARIDRDGAERKLFLDDVTLTVTDSSGLQSSKTMNITITDINDNSPQFESSILNLNITENSTDSTISTIVCNDADWGQNAVFTLSITSGNANSLFSLNGTTLTADGHRLDYEALDDRVFVLSVIAVDRPESGRPRTGSSVIIIKVMPVNEFEPEWLSPVRGGDGSFSNITVSDDLQVGSVISVFEATDQDAGNDGIIKYHLNAVTKDDGTNASDIFSIDEDCGLLKLTSSLKKDTAKNKITTYKLLLIASDIGSSPRSINGTLTLIVHGTNTGPKFNQTVYDVKVIEGVTTGSVVYRLWADDADGDNVSYTLVDDGGGRFVMDTQELRIMKEIDYEDVRHYVLSVKASDDIVDTYATLSVRVENRFDEVPVVTVFENASIHEELLPGTVITVFNVTDSDIDDELEYSLQGNGSEYVSIHPSTGLMTIAKRIDCDTAKIRVLNMELTVTDRGGLQTNTSFTVTVVDINDNAPTCFSPISRMSVRENGTKNDVIGSLNCTDIDDEPNNSFILNIVKGNEDSVFKLLATDVSVDGTKVDYETMNDRDFLYTITIEAIDYPVQGVSRTGVAVVIITVLPENEFTPVWVLPEGGQNGTFPTRSVSESSQSGTVVATFSARDDDLGPDGDIRYSFQSVMSDNGEDMSGTLIINEITGKVKTAGRLDGDRLTGGTEYIDMVITARDNGSPSKSTEGRLRLFITNTNDNKPEFNKILYDVMVTCDKTEKETLVEFGVSDADNASSFSYTVTKGQSSVFLIDDDAGALTLASIPAESDAIKQKAHIMNIVASDGGRPALTGQAFVVIQFEKCPFSNITTTTTLPTTTTTTEVFVYNCSNTTVRECPGVLQMPLVENWALRSACGLMAVSMGIMGVLLLRKNKPKTSSLFKQMPRLATPVIQNDEVSKLNPAWMKSGFPELPASHVAPVDTRAGGILSDLKLESLA